MNPTTESKEAPTTRTRSPWVWFTNLVMLFISLIFLFGGIYSTIKFWNYPDHTPIIITIAIIIAGIAIIPLAINNLIIGRPADR